jgi:glucuronoarabinoxylan endo-1,4-beta-xylanase
VVGARFEKEGLTTKLFGPEHMGEWTWGMNKNYVKEILEDTAVSKYLAFYSVHSYVDGVAADYGSAAGWTNLHNAITKTHGKALWMTETSDFNLTGFDLGFSMARGLYLALKFGEISGWVYWYMADAMIQNNKLTKLGYSFENFYKFIKPGMVQVGCTSYDKSILSIAFRQDTITTVILLNDSQSEKSTSVSFVDATSMALLSAFRTSSTENCLNIKGLTKDQLVLPPKSITTLNFSFTTGTKKITHEACKIYPNPTKGLLHINAVNSSYFLSDLSGRTLRNGKIENSMLDFTGIHQGLYFLTIQSAEGWNTQKLIIDN